MVWYGMVWSVPSRRFIEFSSKNAGFSAFLSRKSTCGQKPELEADYSIHEGNGLLKMKNVQGGG